MIMDEIEKAEIPPPETRSDGDDEHSELEENLYLVFLAPSKGQEHQRKHLANVSLRTKWFPQGPHLPHVRDQLDTCHLPNLVMDVRCVCDTLVGNVDRQIDAHPSSDLGSSGSR